MTRVFVVDDTSWFRVAAGAVIAATDGFELGGSASSAAEAERILTDPEMSPDLVLMDVDLGDGSGIELTASLTSLRPELRIVLMSTLGRADLPDDVDTCGAIGFVPKIDLTPAMLRCHSGGA